MRAVSFLEDECNSHQQGVGHVEGILLVEMGLTEVADGDASTEVAGHMVCKPAITRYEAGTAA